MRIHALLLCIATLLYACGPEETAPDKTGEMDYFPLVDGAWFLYKIDSIDFEKRPYDTLHYWIKEVVAPEIKALDGGNYHQIFVFQKRKWTDNWLKVRTDLAQTTDMGAKRYSENVMFLKQVYPPEMNLTWNEAPYNNTGSLYGDLISLQNAKYVKVNDYHILDNRGYDSTLNIEIFSQYDFINRIDFRERYANHIGLYRRFELNAEFQPLDPESTDSVNNLVPNSGYKFIQTLIDHHIPN
ncbi:hypothetical protein GC194_12050 [bacterium]|nr:hypothetical protein [bacterium]